MSRRASNVTDAHRPSSPECCACHERFSPKLLAMEVPHDDGDGRGKIERWCPRCFVGIRGVRDLRYRDSIMAGRILAIHCQTCGVESLAFGPPVCGQCGSGRILALLPKGIVLKAGALRAAGFL